MSSLAPQYTPDTALSQALNDDLRLEALDRSGLMDSGSENAFDRLTHFAAQMLGIPISLLSIVDGQRQYFKSHTGLPDTLIQDPQTPLTHSFCKYVVQRKAPLIISDAREHPDVKDNPAVCELGVLAYIGVPVKSPDGAVLGSFCAIDTKPRAWSDHELNLMKDLAGIVNNEIQLREEIERRKASEERTQLLARELTHRIKNVFIVSSGIISLSARGKPELKPFVDDVTGRLEAMAKVQDYIQAGVAGYKKTIKGLLNVLLSPYPQEQLSVEGLDHAIGDTATNGLAYVIHELATNAVKYGAWSNTGGSVQIELQQAGDMFRLIWSERGGPSVNGAPSRKGYGSRMMAESIDIYLSGEMDMNWSAQGLIASVTFPQDKLNR